MVTLVIAERQQEVVERVLCAARRAKSLREEMVLSPFLRVLHADTRWNSLLASTDMP